MRTKLIKPQEYERLLKMTEAEIIGFLQATEYRQDIDALSFKDLEDLSSIDKVIAHNNDRVLAKLQKISSENFMIALNLFLAENDKWNLKIIAEAIISKQDPKAMLQNYEKRGTFDPTPYAQAKSLDELCALAAKRMPALRKHPKTLSAFIDAMRGDKALHNPYLIDEENIVRLLMQKREKLAPEQISSRLLRGGTVPRSLLREAANAPSMQDALKVLRTTKYAKAFDGESLISLQYKLHYEVLKRIRRLSGIDPLDATTLVRYLIEKDIEIANIRLLVKGKHLELEEAFLREQLVV